MTTTSDDIAQEHQQALASLNPRQRAAIDRLRHAKQRTHFNGGALEENLKAMFEVEAASRTRAQDEAMLDAAIAAAETATPLETERRRLEAAFGYGFPIAA